MHLLRIIDSVNDIVIFAMVVIIIIGVHLLHESPRHLKPLGFTNIGAGSNRRHI